MINIKRTAASLFFAISALPLWVNTANAVPIQYAGNGHYYEYISTSVNFATALSQAASLTHNGLQGHLATVTSAGENSFIASLRIGSGSSSAYWLAGSDAATEGTWAWVAGPEAGTVFYQNGVCLSAYCNWETSEPNQNGTENALHGYIWWNGNTTWNDISGTGFSASYVVEYSVSAAAAAVPSPASLPLLLSAIGLFTVYRARQRKHA